MTGPERPRRRTRFDPIAPPTRRGEVLGESLGMRSAVQETIHEIAAGSGSGDSPENDGASLVRAPIRAAYSFADPDRAVIFPIRNPADDIRREKETPTLRQFTDEYLRRSEPYWKPSGRKTVRNYVKSRILPTFGRMPLDRIGPEDVAAWFDAASKDRPGAANRAFEILRSMMFRAEEWGSRERGANPCLGIAKNPRNNVARFLDTDELARLGRALDARAAEWPEAVAAIRLLALTGCRRSEVLNLRGRDIGAEAINLPDSKTGPRTVPLGEAARALIEALPGPRDADAFLFPRYAEGRGAYSLTTSWRALCADAKLGYLRLHDLRHTAASQAVMSGENLPLVGKLLGHRRHRTKACPQSLPHYVIEKQDLSVSSPVSTDGASIIRQEPPGSRAPLCG